MAKSEVIRSPEEIKLRNERNAEKQRSYRRNVRVRQSLANDELARLKAALARKDREIAALT